MPLKITYLDKRNLKQDYLKHLAASSKFTTEDDPFQKSFDEIYTKLRSALSELILVQSASHKSSLQNFRIDGDNYEILKSFITSSLNNLTSNPHNQQSVDAFLTKIKESLEPYYDILNGEAGASSLAEKIANLIIIEAREFILTEIARDHALLLSREQAPLSPSQAEAEASALVTPTQRISLARKPQGQNTRFLPEIPSATSMARSSAKAFMPEALEPSFGAKAQRAQTSSTLAEVQRPPRFLEPLKKRPDTPYASLATSMARSSVTAFMPEALEPSFGAKAQRGFSEESDEQDIGNPAPKHQQQIPINESQEIKELKAALQKEIKEKRALKSSSEATILRLTEENTELLNDLRGTRTAYKELQELYRTDFGKFEENVARTRAELDLSDGEAEREATTRLEEEPQAAAREQEVALAAAREQAAATRLKEEAAAREEEDFAKRKELVGRIQEKLATNTGTIQAIFGNLLNFDENIDQSFLVDLGINGDYNINQIQFFAQQIQAHLDSKQSQSGSASARMKTSIAPDIYDEIVAMSKDPLLSLEEAPDDLEGLTQVLHKAQEMEIRLTRLYTASNSKIREAEGRREEAAARERAAAILKEEAEAREQEDGARRKKLIEEIVEKLATNTGTIKAIFGNLLNFDENIDQDFLESLGIKGYYKIDQIQVFAQKIQKHLDLKQSQSGSASARITTSIDPDIYDEIVEMSKNRLLSLKEAPDDLEGLTQVLHEAEEMETRLVQLYAASNLKIEEAEGRREEAKLVINFRKYLRISNRDKFDKN